MTKNLPTITKKKYNEGYYYIIENIIDNEHENVKLFILYDNQNFPFNKLMMICDSKGRVFKKNKYLSSAFNLDHYIVDGNFLSDKINIIYNYDISAYDENNNQSLLSTIIFYISGNCFVHFEDTNSNLGGY